MTRTPMSDYCDVEPFDADFRHPIGSAIAEWQAQEAEMELLAAYATSNRPHPLEPIGLPCPECGHRPALRREGYWICGSQFCDGCFTLKDVLRYLWKPKSE